MLPSQPHSLFVRDRTQASDPAGTSIDHLRGEMQFLRESKEYRLAIEKELEVWMDLLMESDAVDRAVLKRSSLYLTPYDYEQVEHERHLSSLCSYPLCSSSSKRPYTAQSHYTFRTTGVVSSSRTSRNRDLIQQEEGNKDDGFCCKDCLIRSRWFGRRLRDEAIWTRNEVGPGDYGRYKSKARGDPQLEGRRIELEVELLEEMEDRGEVLLQDGHIYMQGSFPAGGPSAVRSAVPAMLVPSVEGAKVKPELPLNGLVKMGLVAETREHPSRFEDQLNATLAGLQIVERVPNGTAKPPSEDKNLTGTSNSESQSYNKMEPKSVKELLPQSQQGNALSSTVEYEEQEEDEEEDEEVKMAFEAAYAAREMLRNGDFE